MAAQSVFQLPHVAWSASNRIGVLTTSPVNRTPSPSVVDAVNDTASLLEQLGHHVTLIDESDEATTEAFGDDFVLYWAFLAGALALGGKKLINPAFDSSKLTSFTRGLADHARRNVHRIPGAIRRLKAAHELYHQQFGACDVVLSPTVSDPAPTLAHLGKDLDYQTHMDRLMRWNSHSRLNKHVASRRSPTSSDEDLLNGRQGRNGHRAHRATSSMLGCHREDQRSTLTVGLTGEDRLEGSRGR